MGVVISMNDYKREHGIALPRSPYYTLDATEDQIQAALERAAEKMSKPFGHHGVPPYAVVVGYENLKTGKVKLLKEMRVYPSVESLHSKAGMRGHYCIGIQQGVDS